MHSSLSSVVAAGLAAALSVSRVNGALTLNSAFLGDWHGVPHYSMFGLFPEVGFNFTIQTVGDDNSGQYLMHDHFDADFYFIPTSEQNFWIDLPDEDSATLHYCGYLYHFYSNSPDPAIADFKFHLQSLNDTQMVWCMEGASNCETVWTLTVSDDGQQLHSEFLYSQPIEHLDVTYTKVSSDTKSRRTQVRKIVDEMNDRILNKGEDFATSVSVECTVNNTAINRYLSGQGNEGEGRGMRKRGGCPYGYDILKSIVKSAPKQTLAHVLKKDASYDFCYRLNPVMDYILQWTFDEDNEELHVQLSIPYDSSDNGPYSYVAIGIEPEWPYMEGMDIALGYPSVDANSGDITPCVRSMYAEYSVGTPVDYSGQVLTDTDVIIDDETNRLSVVFTRPFVTGHHNISRDAGQGSTIMFAMGSSPSNGGCTSNDSPGYHENTRGTFNINWWKPSLILPSDMKC